MLKATGATETPAIPCSVNVLRAHPLASMTFTRRRAVRDDLELAPPQFGSVSDSEQRSG
jgi:hypothetical protein